MRPVINLLLVFAVLLCGLHISPAEADETGWAVDAAFTQTEAGSSQSDDHTQPHAVHTCHTHCPLLGGMNAAQSPETRLASREKHFPAPAAAFEPAAQAPPIEPPAT